MVQITRLAFAAAVTAVSVVSLAPLSASAASAAQGDGGPRAEVPAVGDRLVVTVRDAGGGVDGTYVLYCHPGGGSHPDPAGACDALERNTRWGVDTFGPVPEGAVCTMQYGGPATAHVTGTWAGRAVDATYDRSNGCEIGRWDRMVPLLPAPGVGSVGDTPGASSGG
ncbi:SSI family serine proteinase inhibitor [Streptomyces sp. NPDC048182]|uniref:SSI family serine proteinase inhibitor n=1 Tax=Streptomyces sp. NPDC048182 TaxID=3365507 RepID=UPI003716157E